MSDPILEIITMFMGSALKYSVFIAVITRVGNILVRAFAGRRIFCNV